MSQGFLEEMGYFYYSVNNVIFFVGISQCVKKLPPTEPIRFQIDNDVVKIIECRLSSNMVRRKDRERVLAISHYQSLSFYLYDIIDGNLVLEDLRHSIDLPG